MDANCQTNQQDFVSLAPFIFSATIVTCTVGSFGQRIIDFYLLSISKLKRYLFHLRNSFSQFANNFEPNGLKKSDPPFNLTIMKGSRYVILERGFANFTLKVRKGKVYIVGYTYISKIIRTWKHKILNNLWTQNTFL